MSELFTVTRVWSLQIETICTARSPECFFTFKIEIENLLPYHDMKCRRGNQDLQFPNDVYS